MENLKIAISGARGFVASALIPFLKSCGHTIVPLDRQFFAQPNPNVLSGVNVVINLAGDNIAMGRWTPAKKISIMQSRVETTRVLCEAMRRCAVPPAVLLCASAVGIYGNRGEEILDEDSTSGVGFLPDVARAWEAACAPARDHGLRVVNLRFGMILSPHGGALATMIPLFRLGLGGRVGSGKQWVSWVAMADVLAVMDYVITHVELRGPLNVVAPQAVRQVNFAQALAHALHRPSIVPTPAFAVRLALGQMADELLLASAHVVSKKLQKDGYIFRQADLNFAAILFGADKIN